MTQAQAASTKITIFGMPTFEEQVKQKSKQRQIVEAKLDRAEVKKKGSKDNFIGPKYMEYVEKALVKQMKQNKKMTNFIKLQKYYSDLMAGLYKAIGSLSNYDDLKQFLQKNSFYQKVGSVGSGDIRNFLQFAKDEMNRFENSQAYKQDEADYAHEQKEINKYEEWIHSPRSTGARRHYARKHLAKERNKQQNTENQMQNLRGGEVSILQDDANSLKNHASSSTTFAKQLSSDEKSIGQAFSGMGDFSINIALGYANDLE